MLDTLQAQPQDMPEIGRAVHVHAGRRAPAPPPGATPAAAVPSGVDPAAAAPPGVQVVFVPWRPQWGEPTSKVLLERAEARRLAQGSCAA
jgi:hypothetical protein